MKIQRSHLRIALFVLGAALLYSVFSYMRPAQRVSPPQIPAAPLLAGGPSAGDGQIDPLSIRAPQDIDMARVPVYARDPFLFGNESRTVVSLVSAPSAGPDPWVRSILFSSTRRLAIVEGKIVAVGDSIGAYKVVEIEQGAVVFALAGGERRRVPVHGVAPAGISR